MFAVSLPPEANGKKKPSIIDLANAAYSNTPSSSLARSRNNSTSSTNLDERQEAARTMLGISPCSVTDGCLIMAAKGAPNGMGKVQLNPSYTLKTTSMRHRQQVVDDPGVPPWAAPSKNDSSSSGSDNTSSSGGGRPRSNSAGLDALAFFATQEKEAATTSSSAAISVGTNDEPATLPYSAVSLVPAPAVTSSDDEDSEIMPPPPPRTTVTRRRRSVSNPEGMGDKWGLPPGSSSMADKRYSGTTTMRRLRLVLPTSILEEEMAEANAAVIAKEKSTAAASALAASLLRSDANRLNGASSKLPLVVEEEDDHEEETEEEEPVGHEELLRRARSRLLEDLSQSNLTGEKGVLTLPHSLRKYKEVYNKNGRIGIYTPAERAAIIARFQSKRTRRVWNKKIRYNCRKNLADRRLRVKGRFVKRSTESAPEGRVEDPADTVPSAADATKEGTDRNGTVPTLVPSIPEDTQVVPDTEMPDVSDPDAGFCPTDDQPYRRMRRHTIT